ncbi:uncharacterized protein LOC141703636 [Apium graveolens]|uniref:uncharacterized protein LOC141703614 n=1 Tax=Apium graveolens TaxID=4045 RepID=UPI003D7A1F8A
MLEMYTHIGPQFRNELLRHHLPTSMVIVVFIFSKLCKCTHLYQEDDFYVLVSLPITYGDLVILYRSGLVTAATSFVFAASTAFPPDYSFLTDLIKPNFDFFYALGAVGLGLSLLLIHIYVTEIKRTLQLLWGLGVLGSIATSFTLAEPAGQNLVQYVVNHPTVVWLIGPLFAAFTGLVFKEGLCYGKLEAGVLIFVVPAVLLGHLTGLMDDGLKTTLLGLWMALFVVFAGRMFTQPIKDDIGDKSVFIFNSLPEEEKKLLIEKLNNKLM